MMKFWGKRCLRTCLSVLLAVACLLTSLLFLNIDSNAIERIEIDTTNGMGIVRFTSSDGLVKFQEADSGREGYFHWKYGGDAAYIGMSNVGNAEVVVCKMAGVVMKVDTKYVREIVPYQGQKINYYSVAENAYLMHTYTYYSGNTVCERSLRVGYKPDYLSGDSIYYSYDGHYFYTTFETMISDYRNNTYSNAVNAGAPYYNYYQYLSMHTTATPTAEQYNAHAWATEDQYRKNHPNEAIIEPLMLQTGNAFVENQNKYTMNALLTYGIAFNESQWGRSNISRTKNNLFGLKAYDTNTDAAEVFPTAEACIERFVYDWLHKGYMNGGDSRYRGPHLGDKHSGFNVKYASDPYWGEKAAERGYFLDGAQSDYGRYSIGIARSGMIKFYKEADPSSGVIYTSDTATGGYIYDFPVTILEKVSGANGELFYRVVSDMALKSDRTGRDVAALYDNNRDYVYVSANDVQIVFESGTNIPLPERVEPTKTQQEVLQHLQVNNADNCLTGFAEGSNVSAAITKVRELDGKIQIRVKRADGSEVADGSVATGMVITITTGGSTVDYSVVLRGDVNGDGRMSALDYVVVRKYLDSATALEGAYYKGADTNGDGNVSALDYVILRNHLDNKSTIVQ